MTTVVDVMVQALRELDALVEGAATGGSATTIVDSALTALAYADDHFNEGRAFVLRTTDGLTPQGLSRRVSGFVASTGTLTLASTLGVTVDAGDIYGVGTKRYPAGALTGKLNEFLAQLGDVPTEVLITTLASTLDYALPVAAKRDLRQVWLAGATAAPFRYTPLAHWRTSWAAGGVAANLVFPYQLAVGYNLRVIYMAQHPAVYADTDVISDYLGLRWPAVEVALRLARGRLHQSGDDEKQMVQQINDLMTRAAAAKAAARAGWPEAYPTYPYIV